MNLQDKTKLIQRWAGADDDGEYYHKTADAIIAKAGITLPPVQPPPKVKVAIDPGHGMGNRTPGVYDPGCQHEQWSEATIVIDWAFALADAFQHTGIPFYMTRSGGGTTDLPVSARDNLARAQGCTHFISIHVNDADSPQANGTETLFRDDKDFAVTLHHCLIQGLGLRDRGVKWRNDLAVLNFGDNAALLELGFIQSATDRAAFLDLAKRKRTCELIAAKLKALA